MAIYSNHVIVADISCSQKQRLRQVSCQKHLHEATLPWEGLANSGKEAIIGERARPSSHKSASDAKLVVLVIRNNANRAKEDLMADIKRC